MRKILLHFMLACAMFVFQMADIFAQNKPVFSVPFTLIDNRPFIEVRIRQHTFHFILDCGADYGLDAETARILNQKLSEPNMMGGGAGANKVQVWTTTIDTAAIGPINVLKTNFLVIDMSEIRNKLHLPYFDGIIGYNFMKDYAVQFDYPHHMINFYSTYSGPSPVPFSMYDGSIPKFNAEIDGQPAVVIVDTGDRTAFTLLNHYAIKKGITGRYALSDTTVTGYGLGGPIYARTFRLKALKVGKLKLANVSSRIPMLKTGAFADTAIDGSIGGGVLRQYKFTIDYKKQLLYFE
ncbi:MAG: retroviral-like aspartic protease family protein [Mucilaginibacter sp.]